MTGKVDATTRSRGVVNALSCPLLTAIFTLRKRPPPTGVRIAKIGKRGFRGQKTPISQCPRNGRFEPKIPIFLLEPCREMGIFVYSKRPFVGLWENGFFCPPKNPVKQRISDTPPPKFWGRICHPQTLGGMGLQGSLPDFGAFDPWWGRTLSQRLGCSSRPSTYIPLGHGKFEGQFYLAR